MRAYPNLLTVALLVGCMPTAMSAQTPTPATPPLSHEVQVLSATRLAALADSLPAGAINSVQIARWDGLSNMIGRRDGAGVPERHEAFSDIFVVQRGSATLRYGGTTEAEKLTTPGEWRGGTIRNGSEAVLRPGDIVVIPAGIPHQLLPGAGEHFVYLTFKVAKSPTP